MTFTPQKLDELSQKVGILSSFVDLGTSITYLADDESKQTILKALGYSAQTDAEIEKSMRLILKQQLETIMEPTFVVKEKEQADFSFYINLLKDCETSNLIWKIETEDGFLLEDEVPISLLQLKEEKEFENKVYQKRILGLILDLPLGYHKLTLEIKDKKIKETSSLIIVPEKCYLPDFFEKGDKVYGLPIQLYSLKSKTNWGIGDFSDLKQLVDIAHKIGASFIGVNPLTALFQDNPDDASPYFPSSRLFLNPIYVDVESVPEARENKLFDEMKSQSAFQKMLSSVRESDTVDYQKVSFLKKQAFNVLFHKFREDNFDTSFKAKTKRGKDFEAFQKEKGDKLKYFALFQTVRDLASKTGGQMLWREWKKEYLKPTSNEFKTFFKEYEQHILGIYYQQFVAFEQLEEVLQKIKKLSLGLYTDMPVGVSDNSAEVWSDQTSFMSGVSTGAPPDTFNLNGQDWSLAPFHPIILKKKGYQPFIDVIRSAMKGAGAVRIDHAFGLMRLYLRVKGATGAYLKYPFKDLTGIMALESHRNQCVVIAEDLGTAPEGFSEEMMKLNAFSFKIMHYQRDWNGLIEPKKYPACSLIATGTHDLPSYIGFFKELDLELGKKMKTISLEQYETHKENRKIEKGLFIDAFLKQGFTLTEDEIQDETEFIKVFIPLVYRYLAKTNSQILLVRPEDIFEQEEQFNLPGTYMEYPNWRYKLKVPVEEMLKDNRLVQIMKILLEERKIK